MDVLSGADRGAQLDEIAEALPQRAAALSRLFLSHTSLPISRVEAGVLQALSERPTRITELARGQGVTQPAITLLVNRLEERGWVGRHADPDDGRAVVVALSAAGREAFARLRAQYRALLHEEMAMLDDGEVEILARGVEILDGLITRLAEREQ
jgi:DNA-binding MarR family transcriptional regulator